MKAHTKRCRQAIEHLNAGDLDCYLTLYTPTCTFVGFPPDVPPNLEGARRYYSMFLQGLPDMNVVFEDTIEEDDRLAVRYAWTGTHRGVFMGAEPTGRTISGSGLTIMHFEGDLCTKRWIYADVASVFQQLGLSPATAG